MKVTLNSDLMSVMLSPLTGPEQHLGPYSGLLLLAVAGVSLCVNVLLTIYVVFLWYDVTIDYIDFVKSSAD